jgi:hypothetical protein
MKNFNEFLRWSVIFAALLLVFSAGCRPVEQPRSLDVPEIGPETTVGSLVEVFSFDAVLVEGYSIVGGLRGTGSSECPSELRRYLEKYILQELPTVKVGELIDDKSTAVVAVRGLMPTAGAEERYFDVSVEALAGTQTTSLRGGHLLGVDLREVGMPGAGSRILATAAGPIYIDSINGKPFDERQGRVLGGGRVADEYPVRLALRLPDHKVAGQIRDRINSRFGPDTAVATSAEMVRLNPPLEYADRKDRFTALVCSIYMVDNSQLAAQRAAELSRQLAVADDKEKSEIALEALGAASVGRLTVLLNISDEEARFRAARCLLNLANDAGAETLRQIAMTEGSPYRAQALEAMTRSARHNDATALARRLLRDKDFNTRLAAYESLRRLGDVSIRRQVVGGQFLLEQVLHANNNAIYVYRTGKPRIVLFGAELKCRPDVFVQSDDGNFTINAPAGQDYVSIIRRHPARPEAPPITISSSFDVADIIQRMCESAVVDKDSRLRPGLEIPYADAAALLKKMCDQGAVDAEFRAGPLMRVELLIK